MPDLRQLMLAAERRMHTALDAEFGGDRELSAVARLVVLGELEGKPYDLTSLGEQLGVSRQSAGRCVSRLIKLGLATARRKNKALRVRPTELLMQKLNEDMPRIKAALASLLPHLLEGLVVLDLMT